MSILIGFLSIVLALDALLLILLVLLQLPKKDAGAGVAFGGGTTDALFGAGAGNILTQITKYTAGIFIGLSLVLSVLIINQNEAQNVAIEKEIERQQQQQGLQPVDIDSQQSTNSQSSSETSDTAPITIETPSATEPDGEPASEESGSANETGTQSDDGEAVGTEQGSDDAAASQTDQQDSSGASPDSADSSSEESSSEATRSPSDG